MASAVDNDLSAYQLSASGLAGLLTFLVLHHLWIVPIWFILPMGVVVAALGGVAVHRSYDALRASLPARTWAAPAMFGVVTVILLPSFVLAEMGRRWSTWPRGR